GASHVHRAEQQCLDLIANLFGAKLLEETSVEVSCVVDQHVNAAELPDGTFDRSLSILGTGNVELRSQQVVMVANRCRDLLGIAAGRNNGVSSGQDGLRNVDAHTSACAGDEPNWLHGHA